jgi:hypothetical protein
MRDDPRHLSHCPSHGCPLGESLNALIAFKMISHSPESITSQSINLFGAKIAVPSVLAFLVPSSGHDFEEPGDKDNNRPAFLEAAHDRVQLCADEFSQGQKLERNSRCELRNLHF